MTPDPDFFPLVDGHLSLTSAHIARLADPAADLAACLGGPTPVTSVELRGVDSFVSEAMIDVLATCRHLREIILVNQAVGDDAVRRLLTGPAPHRLCIVRSPAVTGRGLAATDRNRLQFLGCTSVHDN